MSKGRLFSWLGIFALGFVMGTVFFLNSGKAQGEEPVVMEFTVVERAATDVVTDTGAEGDTVGDILTFANEVYDEANENMMGTDQGYCIRVVIGAAWECNWTLMLEDGSVTVEGPFYDAGESVLAITGGTGAYASATGQMLLRAHDDTGTSFDFVYQIMIHGDSE
jgi:allene oxide cyclase